MRRGFAGNSFLSNKDFFGENRRLDSINYYAGCKATEQPSNAILPR